MKSIYELRPFKVRNAEEYDLESILKIFVSPVYGLVNPFEYENSIVKGEMGTGKTMYLRANYAYNLYNIVPTLLVNEKLILPVYINLSIFQHLKNPQDIYCSIIIKLIEELASVYLHLQDSHKMVRIHKGMQSLRFGCGLDSKSSFMLNEILKLKADEYIEKVSDSIGVKGKLGQSFIELSADYSNVIEYELKNKSIPSISDVCKAYNILLKNHSGQIMLLLDEAGSLDKSFFAKNNGFSFFDNLMNQLRTLEYIRTKIAIYPKSISDILTESRYGALLLLNDNIMDEQGYLRFRKKALGVLDHYINTASNGLVNPEEVFEHFVDRSGGDGLEQIIYASAGNIRRLTHLFDLAMLEAYEDHLGKDTVKIKHVISALKRHALEMENLYFEFDKDFLNDIAKACRARGTFRFQFPGKTPFLSKFASRSEEHNLLRILEPGSGRKGTTYGFDFTYCIANDIPTHCIKGSERIDKSRSLEYGSWIKKIAYLTDVTIDSFDFMGRVEGKISEIYADNAFIRGDDGYDYLVKFDENVELKNSDSYCLGNRVKFLPFSESNIRIALNIEMLALKI